MNTVRRIIAKVAATKIRNILSKYFAGLDSSVYSDEAAAGDLILRNLRLKDDAFKNSLGYFSLKRGTIGSLFLSANYLNLSQNPISLKISDIFIVLEEKEFDLHSKLGAEIEKEQEKMKLLTDFFYKQRTVRSMFENMISRTIGESFSDVTSQSNKQSQPHNQGKRNQQSINPQKLESFDDEDIFLTLKIFDLIQIQLSNVTIVFEEKVQSSYSDNHNNNQFKFSINQSPSLILHFDSFSLSTSGQQMKQSQQSSIGGVFKTLSMNKFCLSWIPYNFSSEQFSSNKSLNEFISQIIDTQTSQYEMIQIGMQSKAQNKFEKEKDNKRITTQSQYSIKQQSSNKQQDTKSSSDQSPFSIVNASAESSSQQQSINNKQYSHPIPPPTIRDFNSSSFQYKQQSIQIQSQQQSIIPHQVILAPFNLTLSLSIYTSILGCSLQKMYRPLQPIMKYLTLQQQNKTSNQNQKQQSINKSSSKSSQQSSRSKTLAQLRWKALCTHIQSAIKHRRSFLQGTKEDENKNDQQNNDKTNKQEIKDQKDNQQINGFLHPGPSLDRQTDKNLYVILRKCEILNGFTARRAITDYERIHGEGSAGRIPQIIKQLKVEYNINIFIEQVKLNNKFKFPPNFPQNLSPYQYYEQLRQIEQRNTIEDILLFRHICDQYLQGKMDKLENQDKRMKNKENTNENEINEWFGFGHLNNEEDQNIINYEQELQQRNKYKEIFQETKLLCENLRSGILSEDQKQLIQSVQQQTSNQEKGKNQSNYRPPAQQTSLYTDDQIHRGFDMLGLLQEEIIDSKQKKELAEQFGWKEYFRVEKDMRMRANERKMMKEIERVKDEKKKEKENREIKLQLNDGNGQQQQLEQLLYKGDDIFSFNASLSIFTCTMYIQDQIKYYETNVNEDNKIYSQHQLSHTIRVNQTKLSVSIRKDMIFNISQYQSSQLQSQPQSHTQPQTLYSFYSNAFPFNSTHFKASIDSLSIKRYANNYEQNNQNANEVQNKGNMQNNERNNEVFQINKQNDNKIYIPFSSNSQQQSYHFTSYISQLNILPSYERGNAIDVQADLYPQNIELENKTYLLENEKGNQKQNEKEKELEIEIENNKNEIDNKPAPITFSIISKQQSSILPIIYENQTNQQENKPEIPQFPNLQQYSLQSKPITLVSVIPPKPPPSQVTVVLSQYKQDKDKLNIVFNPDNYLHSDKQNQQPQIFSQTASVVSSSQSSQSTAETSDLTSVSFVSVNSDDQQLKDNIQQNEKQQEQKNDKINNKNNASIVQIPFISQSSSSPPQNPISILDQLQEQQDQSIPISNNQSLSSQYIFGYNQIVSQLQNKINISVSSINTIATLPLIAQLSQRNNKNNDKINENNQIQQSSKFPLSSNSPIQQIEDEQFNLFLRTFLFQATRDKYNKMKKEKNNKKKIQTQEIYNSDFSIPIQFTLSSFTLSIPLNETKEETNSFHFSVANLQIQTQSNIIEKPELIWMTVRKQHEDWKMKKKEKKKRIQTNEEEKDNKKGMKSLIYQQIMMKNTQINNNNVDIAKDLEKQQQNNLIDKQEKNQPFIQMRISDITLFSSDSLKQWISEYEQSSSSSSNQQQHQNDEELIQSSSFSPFQSSSSSQLLYPSHTAPIRIIAEMFEAELSVSKDGGIFSYQREKDQDNLQIEINENDDQLRNDNENKSLIIPTITFKSQNIIIRLNQHNFKIISELQQQFDLTTIKYNKQQQSELHEIQHQQQQKADSNFIQNLLQRLQTQRNTYPFNIALFIDLLSIVINDQFNPEGEITEQNEQNIENSSQSQIQPIRRLLSLSVYGLQPHFSFDAADPKVNDPDQIYQYNNNGQVKEKTIVDQKANYIMYHHRFQKVCVEELPDDEYLSSQNTQYKYNEQQRRRKITISQRRVLGSSSIEDTQRIEKLSYGDKKAKNIEKLKEKKKEQDIQQNKYAVDVILKIKVPLIFEQKNLKDKKINLNSEIIKLQSHSLSSQYDLTEDVSVDLSIQRLALMIERDTYTRVFNTLINIFTFIYNQNEIWKKRLMKSKIDGKDENKENQNNKVEEENIENLGLIQQQQTIQYSPNIFPFSIGVLFRIGQFSAIFIQQERNIASFIIKQIQLKYQPGNENESGNNEQQIVEQNKKTQTDDGINIFSFQFNSLRVFDLGQNEKEINDLQEQIQIGDTFTLDKREIRKFQRKSQNILCLSGQNDKEQDELQQQAFQIALYQHIINHSINNIGINLGSLKIIPIMNTWQEIYNFLYIQQRRRNKKNKNEIQIEKLPQNEEKNNKQQLNIEDKINEIEAKIQQFDQPDLKFQLQQLEIVIPSNLLVINYINNRIDQRRKPIENNEEKDDINKRTDIVKINQDNLNMNDYTIIKKKNNKEFAFILTQFLFEANNKQILKEKHDNEQQQDQSKQLQLITTHFHSLSLIKRNNQQENGIFKQKDETQIIRQIIKPVEFSSSLSIDMKLNDGKVEQKNTDIYKQEQKDEIQKRIVNITSQSSIKNQISFQMSQSEISQIYEIINIIQREMEIREQEGQKFEINKNNKKEIDQNQMHQNQPEQPNQQKTIRDENVNEKETDILNKDQYEQKQEGVQQEQKEIVQIKSLAQQQNLTGIYLKKPSQTLQIVDINKFQQQKKQEKQLEKNQINQVQINLQINQQILKDKKNESLNINELISSANNIGEEQEEVEQEQLLSSLFIHNTINHLRNHFTINYSVCVDIPDEIQYEITNLNEDYKKLNKQAEKQNIQQSIFNVD